MKYIYLLLRYLFFSFFGSGGFYLPLSPLLSPFFLVSVFVFVFVQVQMQVSKKSYLPTLLILLILPLLINLHTPHKIQPLARRILGDKFHEFQSSSIAQYET